MIDLKISSVYKNFPEMLNIRPIVVNTDMVILGGNMRYKTCKFGLRVPIIITDLSERMRIFNGIILGGEWNWGFS